MAPFTHCSPDRPGRFHDGHFGAYYAAGDFETAVAEVTHHQARRLLDTSDEPGWIPDMRELVGAVEARPVAIRQRSFGGLLAPAAYATSPHLRGTEDSGAGQERVNTC